MENWTKLYGRILQSSVWKLPSDHRIVWITLLALKDDEGCVFGTEGWLADQARVDDKFCHEALEKFLGPDARSRTPDNDGRKIEVIKGGWRVLNHELYRDGMEDLREKWRKQKARQRAKAKGELGLSAQQIVQKRVREDPNTIADRIALREIGNGAPVDGETISLAASEEPETAD